MNKIKQRIIFDTNFLLIPYCYKLDIFSEIPCLLVGGYDILIPSSVINELNALSKKKGKEGLASKLALKIIELRKDKITVVKTTIRPDEWIFGFAKENRPVIVCTNDKGLKKKIKTLGLNVISLRSKSRLGVE